MPVTLTPIFLAVALNAAARSQVSRTALMPCSVKCMVVMKVAIAELPPGETVMCGGILSRQPGPVVRWRPPGVGPALATAAAFEVVRHCDPPGGMGKCGAAGCDCATFPRHGRVIRGRPIDRAGKQASRRNPVERCSRTYRKCFTQASVQQVALAEGYMGCWHEEGPQRTLPFYEPYLRGSLAGTGFAASIWLVTNLSASCSVSKSLTG